MKTYSAKPADIERQWFVIDAAGKPIGRIAVDIANLLRGKHKPTFSPHVDTGDFVVVINAEKIKMTGKRMEQKEYYHNTLYPGGARHEKFSELMAKHPDRIIKWAIIDAPLPGIGPWDEILKSPLLWHFNFRGSDVDRLVKGRERIYLDRFWNELSANPKTIDEPTRQHYARIYARPGAMHSAFEQFATFNTKDAADNKEFQKKGKLRMPILALGADKSFGDQQAAIMREVGSNVEGGIIRNSGHWIMEEQPDQTVKAIRAFLDKK